MNLSRRNFIRNSAGLFVPAMVALSRANPFIPILSRSVSSAAGYTMLYDSSSAGGSTVNSSNGDLTYYAGHTLFNIGASSIGSIGKVSFRLTSVGTITGKTYVVKFWSSNGSQDCVAVQATSDDKAGAAWADQDIDFVFSTPWTPSTSMNYNITVAEKSGTADASNYLNVHYRTISGASAPAPGNLGYSWWGPSSGSPGQFGTINQTTLIACMKIYTTP